MARRLDVAIGLIHRAVLLTTHYLDEADQLADRLAIVDRGRVVAEGTPEDLKSELRGDTVHIDVANADATRSAVRVVERLTGMRDVTAAGTALPARADHGASAVPTLLTALDEAGVVTARLAGCGRNRDGVDGYPGVR